ncbi:Spo0E family sporulation regulatory protein-aspartic acid phosphatase [Alicyclobacillus fodiniaquatilis]|uniref:Spo0E family sporulation regulatory protein-aspartic acid phosphatase n=1 Tax=Alicyclobacillus fodiniaquatilis TaxID=1661150 RepID=A0ABW4JHA4_9BACL
MKTRSETVEHLRALLIKTAEERGSLTHPDVIVISQKLDRLLNEVQFKNTRSIMDSFWHPFYRYMSQGGRHGHLYGENQY